MDSVAFEHDSAWAPGGWHLAESVPCQDRAATLRVGDSVMLVVSDGCSTSGETDAGSLLWTKSAASAVTGGGDPLSQDFIPGVAAKVSSSAEHIGLNHGDLDCTVLVAMCDSSGMRASLHGDGACAMFSPAGLSLAVLSWDPSAPPYPSYGLDRGRLAAWTSLAPAGTLTVTLPGRPAEQRRISLSEGAAGVSVTFDAPADGPFSCALLSDGVSSFPLMSPEEAAEAFMSFKPPRGTFARRRLAALLRSARSAGAYPGDDVSVAAVRFIGRGGP